MLISSRKTLRDELFGRGRSFSKIRPLCYDLQSLSTDTVENFISPAFVSSRTTNLLTLLSYFSRGSSWLRLCRRRHQLSLKPPEYECWAEFNVIMLRSTTTTPATPASIRNGLQRSHLGRNNPLQTITASFGAFGPLVCQLFHVLIIVFLHILESKL